MRRAVLVGGIFALLAGGAWCDDQTTVNGKPAPDKPLFFPHNFVRGYVDFDVAPPHNEVDLGLCTLAKTNTATSTTCSAYARYVWSGYVELQPVGRGPFRHLFVFAEPKVFGGDNVPQESYTASASLILWESIMGAGFKLPKHFELRVAEHHVNLLGRYSGPGGASTLRTDGPYGQNSTVGVRWYFGGWGPSGGEGW